MTDVEALEKALRELEGKYSGASGVQVSNPVDWHIKIAELANTIR